MKKILIVEDEKDLLELLEYTLQKEGYDTIGFLGINKNLKQIFQEENIDLVLMDRNLKGCEGSNFIKDIKKHNYQGAVIYLTAKDKNEDILDGFEAFADDYITKPFDIKELCARIKAVLKRTSNNSMILKYKDIVYSYENKKIYINKEEVILSKLEKKLLLFFMENKNILFSREQLIDYIWEEGENIKNKTVNVAVKRLKEKIDPKNKKNYITSIRGEGYIFC